MKAGSVILLVLSGSTLVYLSYKAFCGNGLLGSANSGIEGATAAPQTLSDEAQLNLVSSVSTIRAKLGGTIQSTESSQSLQDQLQSALVQLKK